MTAPPAREFHRRECCELWIGTVQNGVRRLRGGVFDNPFRANAAGPALQVIRTDPLGGTWFGSEFGLFRWDGASLREFGPADGLTPGHIFDLSFDADGDAWVAKADENLVRYRGGRFEPVALPGMPSNVRILSLVSTPQAMSGSALSALDCSIFPRENSATTPPGTACPAIPSASLSSTTTAISGAAPSAATSG